MRQTLQSRRGEFRGCRAAREATTSHALCQDLVRFPDSERQLRGVRRDCHGSEARAGPDGRRGDFRLRIAGGAPCIEWRKGGGLVWVQWFQIDASHPTDPSRRTARGPCGAHGDYHRPYIFAIRAAQSDGCSVAVWSVAPQTWPNCPTSHKGPTMTERLTRAGAPRARSLPRCARPRPSS